MILPTETNNMMSILSCFFNLSFQTLVCLPAALENLGHIGHTENS